MNVTLKLADALCKEARHRAVDEGVSLSRWVATLVERELRTPPTTVGQFPVPKVTLGDLLYDPATADRDFEVPRSRDLPRDVRFD